MLMGITLVPHLVSAAAQLSSATEQCSSEDDGRRWYAVYTRSRHEKQVHQQLAAEAMECFLPLHESVHRWNDRRALVSVPLFPGYLFARILIQDRLRVLTKPGVVYLVGTQGHPAPIPDHEIDALRSCVARHARLEPHEYLTTGERVRVWSGPFADLEGILLRKKGNCRLVLSINLIGRSVTVELDSRDVVLPVERFAA